MSLERSLLVAANQAEMASNAQEARLPEVTDVAHWTISVSRDTDLAVRSFLARHGIEDGLSKFIEDAVKWRVLDQTLAEARAGFADLAPDEIEALADEALASVRRDRKAATPKAR